MSRGLSSKEVYEAIGSSKPSYYRYENGDSEPSTQKLLELASYFNVSMDYLVGRTDNPSVREDVPKGQSLEPVLTPQMKKLQKKLLSVDPQIAAEVENYMNYLLQKNSSHATAAESK